LVMCFCFSPSGCAAGYTFCRRECSLSRPEIA
jgi:hypothetical protein